jgi:hypothetical protein
MSAPPSHDPVSRGARRPSADALSEIAFSTGIYAAVQLRRFVAHPAVCRRAKLLAGGRDEKVRISWSSRPVPPLIESQTVCCRSADVAGFANAKR